MTASAFYNLPGSPTAYTFQIRINGPQSLALSLSTPPMDYLISPKLFLCAKSESNDVLQGGASIDITHLNFVANFDPSFRQLIRKTLLFFSLALFLLI